MMTGRYRKRMQRRSFFSLIEIMVVVVIIGMMIGLVGPAAINKLKRAKRDTAEMQSRLLENAAKDYYLDMSEYPSRLDALVTSPGGDKWDGPYLDPPEVPLDPWGNEYQSQSDAGSFQVFTTDPDGERIPSVK